MSQKKERIVQYTTEQLEAMRAAGLDQTDWRKIRNHSMPEGSDPDDAMDSDDWEIVEIDLHFEQKKKPA